MKKKSACINKIMPKYAVKRYWEVCDSVEVEAENADEAYITAIEEPLSVVPDYVPDSMNIDKDMDIQEL